MLAVRIRPPCTNKYRLDLGRVVQIVCKCGFHRLRIFEQRKRVRLDAGRYEVFYFLERMRRLDVDALDGSLGGGIRVRGGQALLMEGA